MPGSRPVLLVMDFQHGVVDRIADPSVLDAAGRAVKAARVSGIPVMFVRVAFRPGYPEAAASNATFAALAQATLRQAADLDYRLIVLSDACADRDPEVHRVLLEKVFPRQALVTETDEWIQSL
jgi:nicotinamidase-related amidase